MTTLLSACQKSVHFILAGICLAASAVAAPLQLVTSIDPSVGPPASGGGNSMNPIISRDGRYVLFASTADNLAMTSSNTPFPAQGYPKMNVFLRDRTQGTTTIVSVNLAGTGGGNGDSIPVDISTNDQYVLFESSASDLVPGDTNNAADVFVRDLVHGTNLLVSVAADGGFGNGSSGQSTMTPDGRYVAFASAASNLVANDTNGVQDIFVHDLENGTTIRASSDALPGMVPMPPGYTNEIYSSDSPVISPDGRYAAFITTFTPFTPLGNFLYQNPSSGVFVQDLVAGTTTLVTSNLLITGSGFITNNSCYNLVLSDNGQYLAFESSTNSSGGNGVVQRYDLQTGFTDIVCSNAIAAQTSPTVRNLDITPDGRFIVFVVYSNYNSSSDGYSSSFVCLWDGQTATTTLVSCDTNNALPTNSLSDWPAIDSSGRYVVFLSTATSLTTNAVSGDYHLYLRALNLRNPLAGSTTLLDADTNGVGFPKHFLNPGHLTPNCRFVAFDCTEEYPVTNVDGEAYNVPNRSLVPNDNNHAYDVIVRDLVSKTNELISVRQPALPSQSPAVSSPAAVFSVDTAGRFVAFASADNSLVPNYSNRYRSVLVHNLLGDTNVLVSADTNGLANANGMSTDPSMSGDGRYVVFTSSATNLALGDTNTSGSYSNGRDVFLRDLKTGTTTLISVDASSAYGNNSYSPMVSANGKYVIFHSTASIANITGPSYSGSDNLFLRDLQAGETFALTTSGIKGIGPIIIPVSMTPDGHFVAFYAPAPVFGFSGSALYVWDSQAAQIVYTNMAAVVSANLAVSPDGNRIAYCTSAGFYVADRAANTNWLIAPPVSGLLAGQQFSGDSRFMVYSTTSALVPLDTNGIADVYLYDFVTKSTFLVSHSNLPGLPNGPSDSPVISSDGRFVAYRGIVTNILIADPIFGVTNAVPDVFLFDRQTGLTTLLSANASGAPGNNHSFAPQFSGDGQTVVFQTWASDLVPGDYNQSGDLVAVKIATSNPTPVFAGQIVFAPVSGQSPTLTWPAASGANYQVQFKDNLTDPAWQSLNGNVWMDGNSGYATDLAPNPGQRFYRVVAQ